MFFTKKIHQYLVYLIMYRICHSFRKNRNPCLCKKINIKNYDCDKNYRITIFFLRPSEFAYSSCNWPGDILENEIRNSHLPTLSSKFLNINLNWTLKYTVFFRNLNCESINYFNNFKGISNTFGRILIGYLGGLKQINRLYLYSFLLTLCGIATIIEPFFTNFIGLFMYSIAFGFFSGRLYANKIFYAG